MREDQLRPNADTILLAAALAMSALGMGRCVGAALVQPSSLTVGTRAVTVGRLTLSYEPVERLVFADVARNPFRLSGEWPERRLAQEDSATPTEASEPVIPVPEFRLKSLIGGPPWLAVIAGGHGTPTDRVLRTGDTLGPVTVRAVSQRGVVLGIRDSTWRLNFPPGSAP